MSTQFALDLRLARRKAGYTQGDVAHLLSSHQSLVSELEQGQRGPTLEQIIELSLIYGRSFESLFDALLADRQKALSGRLRRLPEPDKQTANIFNRSSSLKRFRKRLENQTLHGSA
ncbi:helix-turn-helix transcriptional regulator [uncultured Roseobacter sp.]|uniref:helix-turn-helix transcriptional regulator n=1 Tax=uncultured Roseobacter sp. TaxID=114847 RepID=UPI0026119C53|nr:helix-turn-helix transcriptional regulator [uncultured Roseobacter sp.]